MQKKINKSSIIFLTSSCRRLAAQSGALTRGRAFPMVGEVRGTEWSLLLSVEVGWQKIGSRNVPDSIILK